jgi:hypothetical protein
LKPVLLRALLIMAQPAPLFKLCSTTATATKLMQHLTVQPELFAVQQHQLLWESTNAPLCTN